MFVEAMHLIFLTLIYNIYSLKIEKTQSIWKITIAGSDTPSYVNYTCIVSNDQTYVLFTSLQMTSFIRKHNWKKPNKNTNTYHFKAFTVKCIYVIMIKVMCFKYFCFSLQESAVTTQHNVIYFFGESTRPFDATHIY